MMDKFAIQQWFEQATDEEALMSIRDIHVHGLDSYVVRKYVDGSLLRVYHARQNLMGLNYPYSPGLSVGIHNHRYNLTLWGIQGKSISYQWQEDAKSSYQLWHYRWRTHVGGNGSYSKEGVKGLSLHSSQELHMSQPFHLTYNRLHTVWAETGAMWVVREGRTYTETTDLYTDQSKLEVGLYHKFEDVRDVRESFARAIDA